ncbi:peroxisomal N(1)-acetyl-spermine/spermidine oxidase-like [Lycorma delicatula]|uniref:peroxisomal N(1)-acetyl-spermine/spermidine oxidase-like n=1 Tax=Lycorma delicatula TaxID=130591 RepID=UPI003F50F5C2
MAGLSAAARLIKAGITDVKVLEATERPGGRIHSCRLANTVAEVGAQWILGSSIANSAMTLAAQEGLLHPKYANKPSPSGCIYMKSDSKPINKAVAIKAYLTFKQIENRAYSLYDLNSGREHGTLMNFLSLAIDQELKNFPEHQRENASSVMYGQINSLSNRWGTDLNLISADLLGSFTRISEEEISIPIGFVAILAPLLRQIPDKNISYKKVVNSIQWTKVCDENAKVAARVAVKCCDGSIYCGDYVIVTVSLGVLKSGVEHKLFTPQLPAEKLEAIKKIGYGNCSKIFLEYSRPFWIWGEGTIHLAWNRSELKDTKDWVSGISSLTELQGSQQVLMVMVAGSHADNVEKISDHKVAEDITALLRKFTGDPSIPYPNSVLRSKWKSSPYFLGSNSFMAIETTLGHQCDLAAPVPVATMAPDATHPPEIAPIILFAGEATCPSQYSTVNGARLSGLRAAQEIIDLTRLYAGPPPLAGEKPKDFEVC